LERIRNESLGDLYFTEIDFFLSGFSEVIEEAIEKGKDVREAIVATERGNSFKSSYSANCYLM